MQAPSSYIVKETIKTPTITALQMPRSKQMMLCFDSLDQYFLNTNWKVVWQTKIISCTKMFIWKMLFQPPSTTLLKTIKDLEMDTHGRRATSNQCDQRRLFPSTSHPLGPTFHVSFSLLHQVWNVNTELKINECCHLNNPWAISTSSAIINHFSHNYMLLPEHSLLSVLLVITLMPIIYTRPRI